jgi:hypothetical protein
MPLTTTTTQFVQWTKKFEMRVHHQICIIHLWEEKKRKKEKKEGVRKIDFIFFNSTLEKNLAFFFKFLHYYYYYYFTYKLFLSCQLMRWFQDRGFFFLFFFFFFYRTNFLTLIFFLGEENRFYFIFLTLAIFWQYLRTYFLNMAI